MDTKKTKKLCQGCGLSFFNGNNPHVAICWKFALAKVITRTKVGARQNPPYTWKPEVTLSCHRPEGARWIDQDHPRIVEPVA